MIDCELSESEWIKLPEAIKFWWSACFPNLPAAANDAAPSITSPWGEDDYTAFVPDSKMTAAAYDFDCKFSEAAFAELVHFRGKRDTDDDSSDHEPIPFGYFSSPRGFCLDGKNIHSLPYPRNDQDIFEHATKGKDTIWYDVLVDRDDFLKWLAKDFPQLNSNIAAPASEPDSDLDAAQMSRTGAPGRPSAMHFVRQELERRVGNGEISTGVSATKVSQDLADWYESGPRRKRPELPQIAFETIRKALRQEIRSATGGGQN